MHNCSFCGHPLRPLAEWKGGADRFYCSEFCADAGDTIRPFTVRLPDVLRTDEGPLIRSPHAR